MFVPGVFVVGAGTDFLEIFDKCGEPLVFVCEVELGVVFEGFELGFEEGTEGLGFVDPLEHPEHGFHGYHLKPAYFQLFLIGLRKLQQYSINQLKQFLHSLVESHIFTAFHQQQISLLIRPQHRYSLRPANRLQRHYTAIERLNKHFVPGERLLKFIVDRSRHF